MGEMQAVSEMLTTHTHHQHLQPHTTSTTTTYGYALNPQAQNAVVPMSDGDENLVQKLSLQAQPPPNGQQTMH